MGKYKHLNIEERKELYLMKKNGFSQKEIVKKIKKHPLMISRKLRRNTLDKVIGCLPNEASISVNRKKEWHGLKLERNPDLQRIAVERLELRILGFETPAKVFHNEMSLISASRLLKAHEAEEAFPIRGIKGGDTHNINKIAL
jgi:hypothetical protein